MNAHPAYWEIATFAELAVAGHLRRQIAELSVDCPAAQPLIQRTQHQAKKHLHWFTVFIGTLAKHTAMTVHERGEPRASVAHYCHHLPGYTPVGSLGSDKIRLLKGSLLAERKELGTVEKIVCQQSPGQRAHSGVYACHIVAHAATKIANNNESDIF